MKIVVAHKNGTASSKCNNYHFAKKRSKKRRVPIEQRVDARRPWIFAYDAKVLGRSVLKILGGFHTNFRPVLCLTLCTRDLQLTSQVPRNLCQLTDHFFLWYILIFYDGKSKPKIEL